MLLFLLLLGLGRIYNLISINIIIMSVRVVARIRPLLNDELERDVIVHAETKDGAKQANIVKIPNPKNESEEFSFTFNSVYDQGTMQEELFNAEGMLLVMTEQLLGLPS